MAALSVVTGATDINTDPDMACGSNLGPGDNMVLGGRADYSDLPGHNIGSTLRH